MLVGYLEYEDPLAVSFEPDTGAKSSTFTNGALDGTCNRLRDSLSFDSCCFDCYARATFIEE